MSEALERIRDEVQGFSTLLARLRRVPPTTADLKEAYTRLSRIKDRYERKESKNLEPVERVALAKVLTHDSLIAEMLKIARQIPMTASERFGEPKAVDHMANLDKADKRILRALDLATRKLSL